MLQEKDGPKVLVEQALPNGQMTPGGWLVAWHIKNVGKYPLWILDVRLPHSCFRSDEQKLDPMPELSPGGSFHLELSVACSEPPGTVVENAFVLLRVLWKEAAWRVFARLRVAFDKKGAPKTTTEVVTTQPVGSLLGIGS